MAQVLPERWIRTSSIALHCLVCLHVPFHLAIFIGTRSFDGSCCSGLSFAKDVTHHHTHSRFSCYMSEIPPMTTLFLNLLVLMPLLLLFSLLLPMPTILHILLPIVPVMLLLLLLPSVPTPVAYPVASYACYLLLPPMPIPVAYTAASYTPSVPYAVAYHPDDLPCNDTFHAAVESALLQLLAGLEVECRAVTAASKQRRGQRLGARALSAAEELLTEVAALRGNLQVRGTGPCRCEGQKPAGERGRGEAIGYFLRRHIKYKS